MCLVESEEGRSRARESKGERKTHLPERTKASKIRVDRRSDRS